MIRMINSRILILTGHVARMREVNAYRILVAKPEELGRTRRRWVDNTEMNLR
jgi:hypothetical protein